MASDAWGTSSGLGRELLSKGHHFAFFQAIRMLRRILSKKDQNSATDPVSLFNHVKIRPNLSLSLPPADINAIREIPGEQDSYELIVNFLGLYGESSPLPLFYTEELFDEAREDRSVTRDFFDLLNEPLYRLLWEVWTKHRLFLKVADEKDPKYLDILFCLLGVGTDELRESLDHSYSLIRYTGLISQNPRSALGLQRLLSDSLEAPDLEIEQCVLRKVEIPENQRCMLGVQGCILGEEIVLGEQIEDRNHKFYIHIKDISARRFRQFLPGGAAYRQAAFLTRFFLVDPFDCDLTLRLSPGQIFTARLGKGHWSQLGVDTWIVSKTDPQPITRKFPLQ